MSEGFPLVKHEEWARKRLVHKLHEACASVELWFPFYDPHLHIRVHLFLNNIVLALPSKHDVTTSKLVKSQKLFDYSITYYQVTWRHYKLSVGK